MASNLKPLVLHAHGTGPNPYKIAAALEFLGLPYEVKLWQFGDAANGVKGSAFLKINENGRVPALEDRMLSMRVKLTLHQDPNTGVVSWESGAVMNYVLRVYDKQNKLGPRGATEQDRVDFEKWEYFLLTTLGPMMGQVNWFRHYHSSKNEDALKRYEEQADRCFGVLDGQIKKHSGSYILPGLTPTAVDLHFYPWVYQHEFAGLSLEKYSSVKNWLDVVGAHKEIKTAYEKVPNGKAM